MSWTRGPLAVLAVCVLVGAGSVGCGSSDARESGVSPTPVGKLLEDRDPEGRPYREVAQKGAPDVGVEVQPGAGGAWGVRLTVRNFRFSPAGAVARAATGRGLAHLYVDGRLVARLRAPEYRLAADLVPRGTHHVTARLYADDGTVWVVDGEPVESTADITASQPGPGAPPDGTAGKDPSQDTTAEQDPTAGYDATGEQEPTAGQDPTAENEVTRGKGPADGQTARSRTTAPRSPTGGRGSPDRAGGAS
ncbi:hypothetical protein [Streptomyces sp. NPDC002788]